MDKLTVRAFMTPMPRTVAGQPLTAARAPMREHRIRHLPVVYVITRGDRVRSGLRAEKLA